MLRFSAHTQLILSSVDCYCSRYLNNNRIRVLPTDFVSSTSSLVYLMLQQNRIKDLNMDLFKHLQSLRWLNLSGNNLTLQDQIFPIMRSLNDLWVILWDFFLWFSCVKLSREIDKNSIKTLENLFMYLHNLTLMWVVKSFFKVSNFNLRVKSQENHFKLRRL